MRGVNAGDLEQASGDLGYAVLNPSVWPKLMERISQAADATGAALLQADVRTSDIPRTESVDELMRRYFDQGWYRHDLRAERGVDYWLRTKSRVVTDQDVINHDELRKSSYYNDLLTPLGFQWFAAVVFQAGTALWVMSLQRTIRQGPFESNDKRLLAALSDRLTEVATLSDAVGRIALSSATSAMDAIRRAAIAIDRSGLVLGVNLAATEFFDDSIGIRDRRLRVTDPQAAAMLDRLFDRLRITPDMAAVPCAPIIVRRPSRLPVVLGVLPVHPAARAPFLGARAILTFSSIGTDCVIDPNLLTKLFGLTPAESKVAVLAAQGKSAEQIAERHRISVTTARNQLKAVLAKTNTRRQSELVAVLSKL